MTNHLRTLRAERGWSQQHLAERLEVSRQSVKAIEAVAAPPFPLDAEPGRSPSPIAASVPISLR